MYLITGLMAFGKSTVSDLLAKYYFENGFSVVIQDNYYGDELNFEVIKEREMYRGG